MQSCYSFSTHNCHKHTECKYNNEYTSDVCKNCNQQWDNHLKFFCSKCDYLKDPKVLEKISYFELFDLEPTFDIDQEKLNKMFYQLQRTFHPDKIRYSKDANEGMKEDQSDDDVRSMEVDSTTYSSFINNGYTVLKDDLERAKYILEMRGYPALAEDEHLSDMELLQHIMETREEIEFANTAEDLQIHKNLAIAEKKKLVKRISRLFALEKFDEVNNQLIRLKYHNRILESIDEKEMEFLSD